MFGRIFCAVVLTIVGYVGPAYAEVAVDTATYTTVHFTNAPESLLRIESSKKQRDGSILLSAIANPCAPSPGGLYRLNVKNAGSSTFHKGELVMTGYAHVSSDRFWAVRHVEVAELSELGGCPRSKQ